jgi:hypothetical protein
VVCILSYRMLVFGCVAIGQSWNGMGWTPRPRWSRPNALLVFLPPSLPATAAAATAAAAGTAPGPGERRRPTRTTTPAAPPPPPPPPPALVLVMAAAARRPQPRRSPKTWSTRQEQERGGTRAVLSPFLLPRVMPVPRPPPPPVAYCRLARRMRRLLLLRPPRLPLVCLLDVGGCRLGFGRLIERLSL